MHEKLKDLLVRYGKVAIWIHFTVYFAVFVGMYVAITAGWTPKGVTGTAGALTAAYVGTKLTQPLRIGATLLLTPIVGKLWQRRTAKADPANPAA